MTNIPILSQQSTATKEERRKIAKQVRALLAERYPDVFATLPKRPLALGINREIKRAMPELSNTLIRIALQDFTYGPRYWAATVEGAPRINLLGQAVSVVGERAAAYALDRLSKVRPDQLPKEMR